MTQSVNSKLAKARKELAKGNSEIAAKLFQSVLDEYPQNLSAQKGLATCSSGTNSNPPAEANNSELAILNKLYSDKKFKEVVSYGNGISVRHSGNSSFFNIIGAAQKAMNNLDAAMDCYQKSLSLDSNNADALNNLGVVYFEKSRFNEAIDSYEKALVLSPNNIHIRLNLARAKRALGATEEAIAHYQTVLQSDPGNLRATMELGELLQTTGNLQLAISIYQAALHIDLNSPLVWNSLGVAQRLSYLLPEAESSFRKALQIQSDNAHALNNLGALLADTFRIPEAMPLYMKALDAGGEFSDAHNNLGNAYRHLGDKESAIKHYTKAVDLNPLSAEAQLNLSQIEHWHPGNQRISELQNIVLHQALAPSDKAKFHLALANAYFAIDENESAFKHHALGCHLIKQESGYEIGLDRTLFSQLEARFSEESTGLARQFVEKLQYDQASHRPIFIVGMPRSGTSLVEQILASHEAVAGLGELPYLTSSISKAERISPGLNENAVSLIRVEYFKAVDSLKPQLPIFTDKMPLNFRWVGYIAVAFPEARIVHVQRDKFATCWSIYRNYFSSDGNGFANDMKDVALYYSLYQGLMKHWERLFPGKIVNLDYDALTIDPEDTTKALLQALHLPWDDACLNPHLTQRPVSTASSMQVRNRIYTGSSEAWKKYQPFIKPMLDILASD